MDDDEKVCNWHIITYEKKCPECGSRNLRPGPRGGMSIEILCKDCRSVWSYSLLQEYGAYKMRKEE